MDQLRGDHFHVIRKYEGSHNFEYCLKHKVCKEPVRLIDARECTTLTNRDIRKIDY